MSSPINVGNNVNDSKSRASSFFPGTSPYRQASLRLGSPVKSLAKDSSSAVADDYVSGEGFDRAEIRASLGVLSHRPSSSSGFSALRHNFTNESSNNNNSNEGGPLQSAFESSDVSLRSVDIDNPDPELVKVVARHLVKDDDNGTSDSGEDADDKFASLRLQGGDITRQIYNWEREHGDGDNSKRARSKSFDLLRPQPEPEPLLNAKDIRAPGGFRRSFIANKVMADAENGGTARARPFLTRNFIEFLSIYGHFAGEELEEEEDGSEEADEGEQEERVTPTERTSLVPGGRQRRKHGKQGTASATKAVMLLLKSFVGTGVLFLPKAFSNGGVLFSTTVLMFVSLVSYWCFLLLIWSKEKTGVTSFGDIGGQLYGPFMRDLILASIVLSQIGFAAAYIVFVSENLQAFILAISDHIVSIEKLIFFQMVTFLPLSMIRDIAKLSGTALIADFFILLGLLYLYYWGARTIALDGVADVQLFNSKLWTLFIGTAIFTYEGIGLIIPIQQSMKKSRQFTPVLGGVMVAITVAFVSMGALQYMAYGSEVKTVIILNLPQQSRLVNGIQLLYSLAIMLSTPLQLFPAIRILENWLFVRSGKYNIKIKWQKNLFRFCLVFFTAFVAWGGADDLDKFVALIGSFACIPLVYVYPPLLHMRADNPGRWTFVSDVALASLGVGAMLYTTYGTLSEWVGN